MKEREIKFRAWDNKKKEWLLGYELPNVGGFSLFGETVLMGEWASMFNKCLFDRNGHKAEDLIVMQFTGLKDENGNEVYEGDIVESEIEGDKEVHTVVWMGNVDYPAFDFDEWEGESNGLSEAINAGTIKVIGNTYENPELLNNKKE